MIYEVDDMIDDSSGRGKDTKYKVNPYYFGTFCNFLGEKREIDLEMIYKVNDMIDDLFYNLFGLLLDLLLELWTLF